MPHARPAPEPAGAAAPNADTPRDGGAALADPVRLAYIAALTRRAAVHHGAVRQALNDKLAQALVASQAPFQPASPDAAAAGAPAQPGPLGQLVQYIDGPAAAPQAMPAASAAAPSEMPHRELKALADSRNAWARLSIERQLSRSLKQVPQNPGPLNSQLLMLRSLRLMQALSPAYLEHFMSHVEALLWLDQAAATGTAAPARPAPRGPTRKTSGGRGAAG